MNTRLIAQRTPRRSRKSDAFATSEVGRRDAPDGASRSHSSEVSHWQKGFTLLELIIVISLATSVSIAGIVAYRDYREGQLLKTASYDLTRVIQLAKSRAISQIQPSDCSTSDFSLDGYRINILSLSQPVYKMSAICEGDAYDTKTFRLPKNIEFDSATDIIIGEALGSGIFFPVITLEAEGAGNIVIRGGGGKTATVSVDSTGTIR